MRDGITVVPWWKSTRWANCQQGVEVPKSKLAEPPEIHQAREGSDANQAPAERSTQRDFSLQGNRVYQQTLLEVPLG